jgi:hypothetical protein
MCCCRLSLPPSSSLCFFLQDQTLAREHAVKLLLCDAHHEPPRIPSSSPCPCVPAGGRNRLGKARAACAVLFFLMAGRRPPSPLLALWCSSVLSRRAHASRVRRRSSPPFSPLYFAAVRISAVAVSSPPRSSMPARLRWPPGGGAALVRSPVTLWMWGCLCLGLARAGVRDCGSPEWIPSGGDAAVTSRWRSPCSPSHWRPGPACQFDWVSARGRCQAGLAREGTGALRADLARDAPLPIKSFNQ